MEHVTEEEVCVEMICHQLGELPARSSPLLGLARVSEWETQKRVEVVIPCRTTFWNGNLLTMCVCERNLLTIN